MTLDEFRDRFPVLRRRAWLDTSAAAPAATPVLEALRTALDDWETGDFSWIEWERIGYRTRGRMARMIGSGENSVALATSLSQAASLVARSLPRGRVVVGDREFRSNLFPWLQLERDGFEIVRVAQHDEIPTTAALIEAIEPGTILVAVSEVLTATGNRLDLEAVAKRARQCGARVFVNLTQSLGALRFDVSRVDADYVAVHGYKWLLCPRGCAWLYARPDRLAELEPLSPGWKSSEDPYREYFGGPLDLAGDARRLDASISQLPWIGADAALELLSLLDAAAIENHAVDLADRFRAGAIERGHTPVAVERSSHIVVVDVDDPAGLERALEQHAVVASVRGTRFRVGFHGFNNTHDVDAALAALPNRRRAH